MAFKRTRKLDFPLEVSFSDKNHLEAINEVKLLGVMVSNDLKWQNNTEYICSKAMKKIWLIRNMKIAGLSTTELIDGYCKEVRSILELAVPVWHSGLTKKQTYQIERIQKTALAIILGDNYINYDVACTLVELEPLWARREKISLKFIKKNMESAHPLLDPYVKNVNTRSSGKIVTEPNCRTQAYKNSSLPYLAKLINASATQI